MHVGKPSEEGALLKIGRGTHRPLMASAVGPPFTEMTGRAKLPKNSADAVLRTCYRMRKFQSPAVAHQTGQAPGQTVRKVSSSSHSTATVNSAIHHTEIRVLGTRQPAAIVTVISEVAGHGTKSLGLISTLAVCAQKSNDPGARNGFDLRRRRIRALITCA